VPSGSWIWKKPSPWMATSRLLPVWVRLPWVWMRTVDIGRTPVPICRPAGIWVCAELEAPGWRRVW
jgi:hypothetical protein